MYMELCIYFVAKTVDTMICDARDSVLANQNQGDLTGLHGGIGGLV